MIASASVQMTSSIVFHPDNRTVRICAQDDGGEFENCSGVVSRVPTLIGRGLAADAVRYNDWIPANQGYRYGVFDPVEGVGTPFFGGYYGHADDDEEPPFPFGQSYIH
jgi:hypothetical protein